MEAVLPEELLRLPEELAQVDALLDDPAFSPVRAVLRPPAGAPVHAMEVYLRADVPEVPLREPVPRGR